MSLSSLFAGDKTKFNFFVVVGVALITVTKIILMNKQAVTDKHFFWTKITCYMVVTLCTVDTLFIMLCEPSMSGKLMPVIFVYILVGAYEIY